MTKKEFEKETYLAPEWGLRVVCVERHYLNDISNGDPDVDPKDVNGDDDSWEN